MAKQTSYREQLNSIKRSPLAPVYIITGAEDYLREAAVDIILKKQELPGDGINPIIKYFGDKINADELNINLISYSLFAEKKFVIIKDARKMKTECWSVIERYTKEPSEATTLLLEDEKIDARNSLIKSIKKQASSYDFPLLKGNQLMYWLKEYASKNRISMSDDALHILRESAEPALRNYVQEFDKIQLFKHDKEKLTASDIREIVLSHRGFNIFDFTHDLCEAEITKVLYQLQQIMLFSESVPGILIMIVRHLTILLKIKICSVRGMNTSEGAAAAGVPPFAYGRYAAQASRVTEEDILKLLDAVLEADTHLKTGYRGDKMILTVIIQQFKSVFSKKIA